MIDMSTSSTTTSSTMKKTTNNNNQRQQTQQQQHNKKKILIFVHGMYGSKLVDKTTNGKKKCSWLTTKTILTNVLFNKNQGHTDVAPKMTWSNDSYDGKLIQDQDDLVAKERIDLFTKNGWDEWCTSLIQEDLVDVRDFVWDWRRPIDEIHSNFKNWMLLQQEGLSSTSQQKAFVLVSYSTGSLFAWPVVNEYPQLFHGWINVGGAIGGGNFILNDFKNGWYIYNNKIIQLLNNETICKIPSMYAFFPAQGEPTGSSMLFKNSDETGGDDEIDTIGDMYDIETWRKYNLGIFGLRQKQGSIPSQEELVHLKNTLHVTGRFRSKHYVRDGATSFEDPSFLIHPIQSYQHLDIVHFGSDSNDDTHSGWFVDSSNNNINFDNSSESGSSIKGNGDGTIMTWAWKVFFGGRSSLNHRVVYASKSTTKHIELMTDPKLQQVVADVLGISSSSSCNKLPSSSRSKLTKITDDCRKKWKGTTNTIDVVVVVLPVLLLLLLSIFLL